MTKKIVALDIDGTLLDGGGELTPRTAAAVRALKDRGIKVVLATGRRFIFCQDLIKELEIDLPVISHNGALINSTRGEKVLFSQPLENSSLSEVLRIMGKLELDFYLQSRDQIFFCREPQIEWGIKHLQENRQLARRFEPENVPALPFHRLTCLGSVEQVTDFVDSSGMIDNGSCRIIRFPVNDGKMEIMELLHPRASKGRALQFLAEKWGVEREEIMAAGDEVNDLEMLEWAGLGVCMGNGVPQLKEVSDLVCGSNEEEGLAEFLEEFFNL